MYDFIKKDGDSTRFKLTFITTGTATEKKHMEKIMSDVSASLKLDDNIKISTVNELSFTKLIWLRYVVAIFLKRVKITRNVPYYIEVDSSMLYFCNRKIITVIDHPMANGVIYDMVDKDNTST